MNIRVYLLAFFLIIGGASILYTRVSHLPVEFIPEFIASDWEVAVRLKNKNPNRSIHVGIPIPPTALGAKMIQESFRSAGLAAAIVKEQGRRSVVWTGRRRTRDPLILEYITVMTRGTSKIKPRASWLKADKRSHFLPKDERKKIGAVVKSLRDTYEGRRKLVNHIRSCVVFAECPGKDPFVRYRVSERSLAKAYAEALNKAGIAAVVAKGFDSPFADRKAKFRYWVKLYVTGKWRDSFIDSAQKLDSSQLIFWDFVLPGDVTPSPDYKVQYSLVPTSKAVLSSVASSKETESLSWRVLSLRNVPVSLQASYRTMLLIPIGALVITLCRSLLGIPTFGTFMPILIALSFRETGLAWGLMLFSMVVSCGLLIRLLLSAFNLLLVSRLSATLSIVIIVVLLTSRIAHEIDFTDGLSVTLFPIVILTMIIERMSVSLEESGVVKTVLLFVSSMIVATLGYEIMAYPLVEYWVFTFPELLLFVLAFIVLLGRYTGYRMSELYRFRYFAQQQATPS